MLVDTSRRSPSYEARLRKYTNRGFTLVPLSMVSTGMPREFTLGRLRLRANGGRGQDTNKFWIRDAAGADTEEGPSDYGGGDVGNAIANTYRNLNVAVKGSGMVLLVGSSFDDVMTNPRVLGADRVESVYRERQVRETQCSEDDASCAHCARAQARVFGTTHRPVLDLFRTWFGEEAPAFAVARLENRDPTEVVDRVIARVKSNLAKALDEARVLKWTTLDPGSQRPLTGSFSPMWESPANFYGPLYRPTLVGLEPSTALVVRELARRHALPRDVTNLLVFRYIIPACAHHVIDAWIKLCDAHPDEATQRPNKKAPRMGI